jgi:5-(carboxyamino)imidazole ribonucleotide synthase
MEKLVTSKFKLGIIAGGQLGKMLVLAASNWDVKTHVLDRDEYCPASSVCTEFIQGDPLNFDDVLWFGRTVDMVTYEIEDINIEALKKLKAEGRRMNPDPDILEIIQDKGSQKEFYREFDIPTSDFELYPDEEAIRKAVVDGKLQLPFVQKLRKGGYDGRGVAIIRTESDLEQLLQGPSVVEDLVSVDKEISVLAARNSSGEVRCYPVVEMEFNENANLVERLVCPAIVGSEVEKQAVELATKIVSSFKIEGILAVEFFVDTNNKVVVNEVAPRPHNSGHHTIESIVTSQFEQLLRSIFNLPLGSTMLKKPSVMINLLGEPDYHGKVKYEGLTESMKIDGVKVHLYGKHFTKPFRKMGHVTVLDNTIEEAKKKADLVKKQLKIKSW